MIPLQKNYGVTPDDIAKLIKTNYANLMQAFYESQSSFLCNVYKRYQSIETANIILCFSRNTHLQIIRQREKDLNFNVSIENFWRNFNLIKKPPEKISSIVKITAIPKETVRRKIKNLVKNGLLIENKINKNYCWNLPSEKKAAFFQITDFETKNLSIFVSKIVNILNIKINNELIENEIRSQFSFYWYHYLSCQLDWLHWWQVKLKDNDLLLIALQAVIPTLNFIDKDASKIKLDNIFKIIGKFNISEYKNCSISASSISEVTGIPRATCMRKLDKLMSLGFLTRNEITKRYSINQSTDGRTKNILSKENVNFTIKTFSEYLAIILNSLIYNKNNTSQTIIN